MRCESLPILVRRPLTKALPGRWANRAAILSMIDNPDDIEREALYMLHEYGDAAAHIARVRAEIAEKNIGKQHLAQNWRTIADAIERLSVKSSAYG